MARPQLTGVVLDTHVLVWLVAGNRRLGVRSRSMIDEALRGSEVQISAISMREIGILLQRGRLALDRPLSEWRRQVRDLGVSEVPVTGDIAVASTELDGFPGDAADRIIGATAISGNAVLVTADRAILQVNIRPVTHNAAT